MHIFMVMIIELTRNIEIRVTEVDEFTNAGTLGLQGNLYLIGPLICK